MTALLAALVLASARPAAPAQSVVATAQARAAREGKNVLILFEASWCRWCRKFDVLLADPALRAAWERSYAVAKINVRERGEFKRLENPGWEPLMKRLRGRDEMDVPYMAVLDPRGKKLADSLRIGDGPIPSNAGYPALPEEVSAFVATVARTGRFTPDEIGLLKARFAPPQG